MAPASLQVQDLSTCDSHLQRKHLGGVAALALALFIVLSPNPASAVAPASADHRTHESGPGGQSCRKLALKSFSLRLDDSFRLDRSVDRLAWASALNVNGIGAVAVSWLGTWGVFTLSYQVDKLEKTIDDLKVDLDKYNCKKAAWPWSRS